MGDTMRDEFEAWAKREWPNAACWPDGAWIGFMGGYFKGRQLGMEQARREQAQWQQPGPVTPDHPLDCLIVLQSLRQSDGDWWIAGSTFLPEYQPVAWSPDTPEVRQALGIPTPPAGDSDTQS